MTDNLLIVEDDEEWCAIYVQAAASVGISTVKVAADLATASALIDDMKFAVAFVDVGLNIGDDQNIDGLRVMAKIRQAGDETTIVVVTGRTGGDVIPVANEAFTKYQIHEILRKAEIEPEAIRELLRSGVKAYETRAAVAPAASAQEVLRGEVPLAVWDDRMLTGTGVKGGVPGLYDFLSQLMAGFFPAAAKHEGDAVTEDPATGIMHGSYWSRSVGAAIAVSFTDLERAEKEIETASRTGSLLARYDVDTVLRKTSGHGLGGAVFALRDVVRSEFFAD